MQHRNNTKSATDVVGGVRVGFVVEGLDSSDGMRVVLIREQNPNPRDSPPS